MPPGADPDSHIPEHCVCSHPPPEKPHIENGERIIKWWESYLAAVVGVSTFGGSITFSIIMTDLKQPADVKSSAKKSNGEPRLDVDNVRDLLADAWVAFIALLAVSSLLSTLLAFYRMEFVKGFSNPNDQERRLGENYLASKFTYAWALNTASLLISILLTTAFMFLSLVVVAYAEYPGWAGVTLSSTFGLVTLLIWFKQAVWWPRSSSDNGSIHSTQCSSSQQHLVPRP